jgi:glutamate-5-semialdehyde dehydrogenase
LNHERIAAICQGVREVAILPDPIGNIEDMSERPNGLKIGKMRVPLGVMASVYEARPNVTIDIAAIAVKSGNAVVLRSGSDAHRTSSLLAEIARRAIGKSGLDPKILQFIESTDREEVSALLAADQYIDLVVPRGGTGLINKVKSEARMPVVAGGVGVCHTYVHADADVQMATDIVVNAKTRRPSVCNTLDTVLVHREVASQLVPRLTNMLAKVGVSLHADSESIPMIDEAATVFPVKPEDYDTEWLSLNCSIKLVDDMQDALDHIGRHGTGHSEAIVTSSTESSKEFLTSVDAAAVFVNASTGFNDGGEFGLGCELGISTQKMHARGPMGLRELTSYKWIVLGDGQIRP